MGFELVDEHLLDVIQNLVIFCRKYFSGFITAGQALGALMSIFVVAGEAYKVMVKQKGFDVLAIMRPIAIAIVIANWIPFTDAIGAVPRLMESYAQGIFEKEHREIKTLREIRTTAAENIKERTTKARAAADLAEKQIANGNIFERLMEMGDDMLNTISDQLYSFGTIMQAQVNQVLEEWVMKIGEFFWQIQVYLLFFIKEVFAGILVITGPITFGLSVLPIWKDAWSQWVARYISVLLYGFVGFFVLAAALQLVKYGVRYDTEILNTANSTQEAFAAYSKSSVVTALFHFITLIVGGLAIKMVPELATWIIPSTAGHAAKEFVAGAYGKMKSQAGTAINLATGSKK